MIYWNAYLFPVFFSTQKTCLLIFNFCTIRHFWWVGNIGTVQASTTLNFLCPSNE